MERQLDPIEQDEQTAVLHALDHAFDEHQTPPSPPIGKPDLIYEDYLRAADAAWMGKPWEKPAADHEPARDDQEKDRC